MALLYKMFVQRRVKRKKYSSHRTEQLFQKRKSQEQQNGKKPAFSCAEYILGMFSNKSNNKNMGLLSDDIKNSAMEHENKYIHKEEVAEHDNGYIHGCL